MNKAILQDFKRLGGNLALLACEVEKLQAQKFILKNQIETMTQKPVIKKPTIKQNNLL